MGNDNKTSTPTIPASIASMLSPEAATEFARVLGEAMSKGMKEGMAMGMAMQEASRQEQAAKQNAAENAARARREQSACPKCGIPYMACGGPDYVDAPTKDDPKHKEMKPGEDTNHVMMVVYANNRREARFFDGIHINSHRFVSNGPNHLIPVPRHAPVAHTLSVHMDMLDQLQDGRQGMRQVGTLNDHGQLARNPDAAFTSWTR